jgi:hypothetical protein
MARTKAIWLVSDWEKLKVQHLDREKESVKVVVKVRKLEPSKETDFMKECGMVERRTNELLRLCEFCEYLKERKEKGGNTRHVHYFEDEVKNSHPQDARGLVGLS